MFDESVGIDFQELMEEVKKTMGSQVAVLTVDLSIARMEIKQLREMLGKALAEKNGHKAAVEGGPSDVQP